jgi:hypothetical protein
MTGHTPDGTDALTPEQRELLELLLEEQGITPDDLILAEPRDGRDYPLSLTQQRLWTAAQLAPDLPYGNVAMGFRVRGEFDRAALAWALQHVVDRHEMLRTAFPAVDGSPVQRIANSVRIELGGGVAEGADAEARATAALRAATAIARAPFDLERSPLLRAACWSIAADDHLVLFVTHHLAMDGWGMRVFLREVSAAYDARLRNAVPPLPPIRAQYVDIAAWQHRWLAGPAGRDQLRYWVARLAGAPPVLALPTDRPRTAAASARGDAVTFAVTAEVAGELRRLAREGGVTLYATLVAALQAVLSRWTGQTDVVLGTTMSNRSRSETESLIGNLGNNVLLRADLSGDPTFRALLRQVGETAVDAYAHQEIPLETVLAELRNSPGGATVPQLQVIFILREAPLTASFTPAGTTVEATSIGVGVSMLELRVDITDDRHGLAGLLEYRTDLFDRETIASVVDTLTAVLARVATNADTRLSEMPAPVRRGGSDATAAPRAPQQHTPPRSDTERALAQIWQAALGIERVGVHDNFFDIGGHSLLAMNVIAETQRRTGVRLRPLDLSMQTLGQLAARCEQEARPAGGRPSLGQRLLGSVRSALGRS